jgi:hypothetical protein
MAARYTSIKEIIEKLFRDNGYTTQVDFYDAAVWAGEALDLVGVPMSLDDKIATIEIEDHRGKMPCGWVYIQGTRDADTKQPYRYESSSFFHTCHTTDSPDLRCNTDLTYKVNDGYFFSAKKDGKVEIAYKGYATDDDGFPLIPDTTRFKTAVAAYIRMKIDYIEMRKGKLNPNIYQMSEQEWLFYVNSAATEARMPSIDQMESLKNQMLRLIPQPNEHATSFKTLSQQERRWNN